MSDLEHSKDTSDTLDPGEAPDDATPTRGRWPATAPSARRS